MAEVEPGDWLSRDQTVVREAKDRFKPMDIHGNWTG
jgi:hypothetical protein